jgi:hypothetical protein
MSDTTETDNIYSPHNACMFRVDCRKRRGCRTYWAGSTFKEQA